jgi:hypothetical protein
MRPKFSTDGISSRAFFTIENSRKIVMDSKIDQKTFIFDFIADDKVDQSQFFDRTGISISQACIEGFNGTIIFYGQTGELWW